MMYIMTNHLTEIGNSEAAVASCSLPVYFTFKSSRLEMLLRKDVLKVCSKFTGGHPRRSVKQLY